MYLLASSFDEYVAKSGDISRNDYVTVMAWINDLKATGQYDEIVELPRFTVTELVELLCD
jgi:hypothetical protein